MRAVLWRILAGTPRTGFQASPKETEPKRRTRTAAICLAATRRPSRNIRPSVSGSRARRDITRANAAMQKILAVDRLPETVVVLDEGGDEFMQAGLKNFLCRCVREPRDHLMGLSLRRADAAIGAADCVEEMDDIVVAGDERARHFLFEDQKIGDQPWLHALAIDPMIGGERRDRSQDRGPLEIVERPADRLVFR